MIGSTARVLWFAAYFACLFLGSVAGVGAADQDGGTTTSVISQQQTSERKARVDALFARLKAAGSAGEAEIIVKDIWDAWTTTGHVDVDALMNQARLAVQEGGFEEAFGALDRVIEIAPDYAEGWNRRATYHFFAGNYEKSVLDIRETLVREPRHFGALAGLSQIYAASGNWKAALNAYEKAVAINPYLPEKDIVLKMLREKALGERL